MGLDVEPLVEGDGEVDGLVLVAMDGEDLLRLRLEIADVVHGSRRSEWPENPSTVSISMLMAMVS